MAEVNSAVQSHSSWIEYFDEASGLLYYHNEETNETVWEKPEELEGEEGVLEDADPDDPMHWEEYTDSETGKVMFHNNVTGEDTDEKPECLKTDEEKSFKKVWWKKNGSL